MISDVYLAWAFFLMSVVGLSVLPFVVTAALARRFSQLSEFCAATSTDGGSKRSSTTPENSDV